MRLEAGALPCAVSTSRCEHQPRVDAYVVTLKPGAELTTSVSSRNPQRARPTLVGWMSSRLVGTRSPARAAAPESRSPTATPSTSVADARRAPSMRTVHAWRVRMRRRAADSCSIGRTASTSHCDAPPRGCGWMGASGSTPRRDSAACSSRRCGKADRRHDCGDAEASIASVDVPHDAAIGRVPPSAPRAARSGVAPRRDRAARTLAWNLAQRAPRSARRARFAAASSARCDARCCAVVLAR